MAFSSYGFQEVSCGADEVPNRYSIESRNHRNSHQITFEDLGIPRIIAVRPTIIGNIRTSQNLNTLDWVLLIGGLLSVFVTFGLAIDRFILLQPKSIDFMFAVLLLYNAIFSALYIFNAVFKEQAFEALAYALTSAVVIVYVAINYAHEEERSVNYVFKLVRLIVTLVLCGVMGIVAIIVAVQQMQSENLIFRTVGADSSIQSMCRTLFTTITLIHFDVQLLGSCIILSVEHGITSLSVEEILFITIGFPWIFAWALLAYFTVRCESRYFFTISMFLSPGHFIYLIFTIVKTILEEKSSTVSGYCKFAAGALGLIIHAVLLLHLIFCKRNFGRGLKEKVFPSRRNESTGQ